MVTWVMQFIEIGVILWEQDYKLAVLLLAVTLGAKSVIIARLYSSRLKLYKSVSRRHFVPIVHAGQVRHACSPSPDSLHSDNDSHNPDQHRLSACNDSLCLEGRNCFELPGKASLQDNFKCGEVFATVSFQPL